MKPAESFITAVAIADGMVIGGAAIESYAHLLPQPLHAVLFGSAVLIQIAAVGFAALSLHTFRKTYEASQD